MSKKAATVGDIGTDHDGFPPTSIIEGSQDIIIDNKPAARVGDALAPHAKPNHPPHDRAITTGSKTVFFNHKPAALTGSEVGCGGVIIGGSSVIIGDQAPFFNHAKNSPEIMPTLRFDEQMQAMSHGKPIKDYPYYAVSDSGVVLSGRTDDFGLTDRICTNPNGVFDIYWGDEALALMEGVYNA